MSSILEALKKLEAEKGAQYPVASTSTIDDAFGNTSFLDDRGTSPQESRPFAPLLWVLGGGVFTVLIIGVSVLLVMLLQQKLSDQSHDDRITQAAETPPTPPASPVIAVPEVADVTEESPPVEAEEPVETMVTTPVTIPNVVEAPVVVHVNVPVAIPEAPPEVRPRPTPSPAPAPEPPVKSSTVSEPVPEDIRSLPMLTRQERSQYNLDGVQLNMLNAAGPTRPLGNAFINLEKVFIGEFLPDSNAVLLDVESHGIAIEIQSTRQRYYIPR